MSEHRDPAAFDHESDPAHTPGMGWVDEGGASYLGPATHLQSGHGHPDDEENDKASSGAHDLADGIENGGEV